MLVLDRFEGEFIVCIDGEGAPVTLEKTAVLAPVKEGDVLVEAECGRYVVDKALSASRRKEMRKRLDSLFKK